MPLRFHALVATKFWREREMQGIFGGRGLPALGLICAAAATVVGAQDPVLRDVEVRSFLGEHLNLRVALAASTEPTSTAICQTVIDSDRRENALRSADLILSMVELRTARYLQVRSRVPYNEPIARFSLRIGCPGEPIVDREFTVLLDPPPFTAVPTLPTSDTLIDSNATAKVTSASGKLPRTAKSASRVKPVVPSAGSWTVREGDTLSAMAKGIHPKNRARQQQYLASLRDLNPSLAGIADDTPLAAGSQLALPDLLTLSGILPASDAPARRAAPTVVPKQSTPTREREPKAAAVPRESTAATPPAAPRTAPAAVAPPPARTEPAKSSATKPAPPVASTPTKAPPVAKPSPRAEGFQLRLSGSEMDLSRSRNITDEQRRQLREKQLMLDADDQVAALLSLRNTVKQLEQRLNEVQLKQAASAATMPAPVPAPATLALAPATAVAPTMTVPAAQPSVATPSVATPSAATPSRSATQMEPPAPAKAVPTPPAPAKSTGEDQKIVAATESVNKSAVAEAPGIDLLESLLPSPMVTGGIAGGLALLFGAWFWSRRSEKPARAHPTAPPSHAESTPGRAEDYDQVSRVDLAPVATPPIDNFAQAETSNAYMQTTRNLVVESPPATQHQYVQIDAPVVFDEAPARFEVDSRPATTVDFLVGMDEQLPEDRVRRLKYMHERYPELQSNTVSIDDADSVINAARLYYDEADTGGHDKASELLTFAVEERPQEMRFWLAQFEIFRLENMVNEFTELAGKFHVLFSHTPAWPKVRHIGHELAPGNPLFAASGGPLLAGETRFDPIAENWLNAPMDFTSDALMSDLRMALLDDHGVDRADFDSITARLSVSAAHA